MDTITVPATEWKALNETVSEIYSMLKAKPVTKVWVRTSEFMKLTGKNRDQMNCLLKLHPELKRKRLGEGVQVNYKAYQKMFNQ